jgi:hypothetical protein
VAGWNLEGPSVFHSSTLPLFLSSALAEFLVLAVALAGIAGGIASANSRRFRRRVAREVGALWSNNGKARDIDRARIETLPPPVHTYLRKALGQRTTAVQAVRFRHGGRFRTKLDGPWQPIRGEQYETDNPPGFLWWGRLRAAPGLWIDARDRCVNGEGSMLVSLESTFTIIDRSGPQMDQGSMLRLLSDLVLFPTALLDPRFVTWSALDERRARATLRLSGREVTGTFEFGADGLPRAFFSDRYFDTGAGEAQLRPWSGEYLDYRPVDGMMVPHHFIGYWHIDGTRIPYVDFQLERPEYDCAQPFAAGRR